MDTQFALARCGYAEYILTLTSANFLPAHEALPRMRNEARKALEIDPLLPEAHAMLGIVAGVYDYDWKEAEQCFRRAMAHEPVPPGVRHFYGWFHLLLVGRMEEAIEQQKQGLKEDPLNISWNMLLAYSLITAGRPLEAGAAAQRVLEFDANNAWGCLALAWALALQERWGEALHAAEKVTPMIPEALGFLAAVLKHVRQANRAGEFIQKLISGEPYGIPKALSTYYFMSGEIEKAADWIEKMIEQRHLNAAHHALIFSHSSLRYHALLRKMNLEP